MTRREILRKFNEVAKLRLKKLDEIRDFLSISPDADDQDVLGLMKWWQKTAANEPSVPAELKTEADRLCCDLHSINDANLEIIDKLEALGRRGRQQP